MPQRKRAEIKYQSSRFPANVREAAREYGTVRRLYKKIGKAAMGKPKSSQIHKDYVTIRGEYQRTGKRLAKLTGHPWKTQRS
jgi:hypothetical protein